MVAEEIVGVPGGALWVLRNQPAAQISELGVFHGLIEIEVWGSGGVGGFRVDGDAGDLGKVFLDAVFESGGDIVDPGDGEFTLHDAVAGNKYVMLDLADANIVTINELVVRAGHAVEESFHGHLQLAHLAGAGVGSRDMAAERLDVNVYVDITLAEFADAIFEFGGAAVGFAQAEVFIHFEVEFDKEVAVLLRGGDVVHSQAEAESDSADGFEQALIARGPGFGVDNDVRGHDLGDAFFDFVGQSVNLFEVGSAGDADGRVDEIAVAGAAKAHSFHAQHTFHVSDFSGDLLLQAGRGGVEKRIKGAAAELGTDP